MKDFSDDAPDEAPVDDDTLPDPVDPATIPHPEGDGGRPENTEEGE